MSRLARALTVGGPVIVFAVALLLPLGWVAAHGWTLTSLYEESIGYRYFYSLRVVYGNEYTFLPQGHLIDVGYQWLQRVLTLGGQPPDRLFPRIDVFAYAAVAAAHLTSVVCFAWAVGPVSTLPARLLALLFWLTPYFGMWHGVYVLLQPDYHAWILPIGLVTAGVYSRWEKMLDQWSVRQSLSLGVFFGIAAGVKGTLVVFPATIALGWMLAKRSSRRTLRLAGLSVAVGIMTWLAILLVNCQWRFDRLALLARDLATFAETIRQAEPYSDWLAGLYGQVPVLVTLAVAMPAPLSMSAGLVQRPHERAAIIGLAVGAVLYHAILYWRFVPATWFEAVVFLHVTVWSVARMMTPRWWSSPAAVLGALMTAVVLLTTGGRTAVAHVDRIGKLDDAGDELARVLRRQEGRAAFLIPDNSFTPLSVDSAIAKGMNNIFDERLSRMIRRMFPERAYFLGAPRYPAAFYQRNPVDVSGFSAVVFVVPVASGRSKAAQVEALEGYFSVSLAPFDCTRDIDFLAGAQIVVVCARNDGTPGTRQAARLLYCPEGDKVQATRECFADEHRMNRAAGILD